MRRRMTWQYRNFRVYVCIKPTEKTEKQLFYDSHKIIAMTRVVPCFIIYTTEQSIMSWIKLDILISRYSVHDVYSNFYSI